MYIARSSALAIMHSAPRQQVVSVAVLLTATLLVAPTITLRLTTLVLGSSILDDLNESPEPVEFSDILNGGGTYVSRNLRRKIDYNAGLYEPTYHIQQQKEEAARSMRDGDATTSTSATRSGEGPAQLRRAVIVRIDALDRNRCGRYRSSVFDDMDNAYECSSQRQDLRDGNGGGDPGKSDSGNVRRISGDNQGRKTSNRKGGKKTSNRRGGRKIGGGGGTRKASKGRQKPKLRPPVAGAQRLSGGYQARLSEYPSFVFLTLDGYSGGRSHCGGVVIHSNLVLTAAHCVDEAAEVYLNFGQINIDGRRKGISQERKGSQVCLSKFFSKPDYTKDRAAVSDLALVKFYPPLYYTDYVKPICLDSLKTINPRQVACMGVGAGEVYRDMAGKSEMPQVVKAMPMQFEGCRTSSSSTLCTAYSPKFSNISGGHSCDNDSGGPLICALKCPGDSKNVQVLQGILSAGEGGATCLPIGGRQNVYMEMYKNRFVIEGMLTDCGLVRNQPVIWWNPATWG